MKNFSSFFLLLDILDIKRSSIPYILFKLQEIKKSEAISPWEHTLKAVGKNRALTLFSLYPFKSIGILDKSQRTILDIVNIGEIAGGNTEVSGRI